MANETENETKPEQSAQKRLYIDVPREQKEEAKPLGAKWDGKAGSWYIQADNPERKAITERWPAQTSERLEELKAERAAARAENAVAKDEPTQGSKEPAPAPEKAFGDFLRSSGAQLKGAPVMDGKWHRVAVEGDKGKTMSATYRGFTDGRPNGTFDNKKTGEQVKWKQEGFTKEQLADRTAGQTAATQPKESQSKEAEADLAARREAAGKRAFGVWSHAKGWATPKNSTYLAQKGVNGHGIKVDEQGKTLVPLRNAEGHIKSLQIIDETSKMFMRDGEIKGNMHIIDPNREIKDGASIAVAEGYATAASVHAATKLPVAVAFNATNLKPVAEALKEKYPDAKLIIAADNDHKLEGGKQGNVGLDKAKEAAHAVGGRVMAPKFTTEEKSRGLSDWNDMHRSRGADKTREAMKSALRSVTAEKKRMAEATKARTSRQKAGMDAGMSM